MNSNTAPSSKHKFVIQSWLRPDLTPVLANCDYERLRQDLDKIEANIRASCVEALAIDITLDRLDENTSSRCRDRNIQFAPVALRMELLRHLLGMPSFREFSARLSSSDLLADFCNVSFIEGNRWTSKSTLERASKFFTHEELQRMNALLTETVANSDLCADLGLEAPVDASICLVDSTCFEANIHFPTDWVLLKDVALTLLKATTLIRSQRLLNRMSQSPAELARQMNRLCIEMTHSRRRKDAKKRRKAILRRMKKLLRCIGDHARKHRELLETSWDTTELSQREAERILARIDSQLELLPQVMKQAHERIIGERKVSSGDKILSAHEPDIHTLVRGKAGKEVEFGNALFIAESPCGFILDYELYRDAPPGESQKLRDSLARQRALDIETPVDCVVADRGFDSRKLLDELGEDGIVSHICPRNAAKLKELMCDESFRSLQKRRGGTEARIAILKNKRGGRVCRAKGFENRARAFRSPTACSPTTFSG